MLKFLKLLNIGIIAKIAQNYHMYFSAPKNVMNLFGLSSVKYEKLFIFRENNQVYVANSMSLF